MIKNKVSKNSPRAKQWSQLVDKHSPKPKCVYSIEVLIEDSTCPNAKSHKFEEMLINESSSNTHIEKISLYRSIEDHGGNSDACTSKESFRRINDEKYFSKYHIFGVLSKQSVIKYASKLSESSEEMPRSGKSTSSSLLSNNSQIQTRNRNKSSSLKLAQARKSRSRNQFCLCSHDHLNKHCMILPCLVPGPCLVSLNSLPRMSLENSIICSSTHSSLDLAPLIPSNHGHFMPNIISSSKRYFRKKLYQPIGLKTIVLYWKRAIQNFFTLFIAQVKKTAHHRKSLPQFIDFVQIQQDICLRIIDYIFRRSIHYIKRTN